MPVRPGFLCRHGATIEFLEIVQMWKALVAGGLALAIAGSTFVYAQQRPSDPAAEQARAAMPRFTAEDAQAFADARVAALKAGLKLTPEQEKNWPPVEAAIRDLAKQRFDRVAARRDAPRDAQPDPIQRLRQRADTMTQTAAGLKRLADAADPLYKSLDDGQKRRLTVLTRTAVRPGGPGHVHRWHRPN